MNEFVARQRKAAAEWKRESATLPEAARAAAPYVRQGEPKTGPLPFCLPADHAQLNLLPEVREEVIALFAECGIPWHAGIDEGPSNHLLDSQVQCANALGQLMTEPARLAAAFDTSVDLEEVVPIEGSRLLTFEYIGDSDYLTEAAGKQRVRGSRCTSVDAAFAYRTSAGMTELALVEWKYTESYKKIRNPDPRKDATRTQRYAHLYGDPGGPLKPLVSFELMLDEPFYQLMRQQLLAHAIERDPEQPFDTVRILHVLDPDNIAYQESIVRPEMKDLGDSVDAIWSSLLRDMTRFVHVNPRVFRDPRVTSNEYVSRYPGPT